MHSKMQRTRTEFNRFLQTNKRKNKHGCFQFQNSVTSLDNWDVPGSASAAVKALAIDHILEEVFHSLNASDLKKCRLVSNQWNSVACVQLLEKSQDFVINFDTSNKLKQFVRLLRQRTPNGIFPSLPFPCGNFSFEATCKQSKSFLTFLKDKLIQELLTIHGVHTRQLYLNLSHKSVTSDQCKHKPSDSEVMDLIYNLLVNQTPNLFIFQISGAIFKKIDCRTQFLRENISPLYVTDAELHDIHDKYKERKGNEGLKNTKLAVFSIPGYCPIISAKVLEMIFCIAPNLREVDPYSPYHIYFLEPFNRLHLLKKLDFTPYHVEHVEILEKIADASEGGEHLKLREFRICLMKASGNCQIGLGFRMGYFLGPNVIKARVGNVISRILENNKESLMLLQWNAVTFLSSVMWPTVMPNLLVLGFGNPYKIHNRHNPNQIRQLFPPGFNWSSAFPKLQCISLYDSTERVSFTDFVSLINYSTSAGAGAGHISRVQIKTKEELKEEHFVRLQTLFPRAQVKFCPDGFKPFNPFL